MQWVARQLARFTYKPGWTFRVEPPQHAALNFAPVVIVTMTVPDSRRQARPGERVPTVDVTTRRCVPLELLDVDVDDQWFSKWLLHVIFDMEMHEAQEWLRLDGELVDDPHAPTGDGCSVNR